MNLLVHFSVLVVVLGAFPLTRGAETGGQTRRDPIEVCDLCSIEGLPDCSKNNNSAKRRTVNCELPDHICTLQIVDTPPEDLNAETAMKEDDNRMICLLGKMAISKIPTTAMPTTVEQSSSTFEAGANEPVSSSTILTTEAHESMNRVSKTDSVDYQHDVGSDVLNHQPFGDSEPPIEYINCFICDSLNDTFCFDEVERLKHIQCPKSSGCMSLYSGNRLVRNCSSSFPPAIVAECQKSGNTMCEHCMDTNCNKAPWKQCYTCNSKNGTNCAQWSENGTIAISVCPRHDDRCLTRITSEGHTVRECAAVDYKGQHDELYSVCGSSLCNSGVYPKDRLKCVQCKDCQVPIPAQPCALYVPQEQCFMYIAADSKLIRGCVSNASEMMECRMNAPKCVTCSNKDSCNDMPLMREPSLSCSKCNSFTDPSCAWTQPITRVVKCHNKVLYYLQETCMTEYDPVTKNAIRDCSFDHGTCLEDDRNCSTCIGDGCNRANLRFQECIQCNSEHPGQENCKESAEGILSTRCPQDVQLFETKGCFSMTKGSITIRGCTAELSDDDMELCKSGTNKQCMLCDHDGCNNKTASSRAWKIGQSYGYILVGLLFGVI